MERSATITADDTVSHLASPAGTPSKPAESSAAAKIASLTAETCELRAELEQVRTDRDRLAETQRRIMEVLGIHDASRLVHDLRNVLNERELFRALAKLEAEEDLEAE